MSSQFGWHLKLWKEDFWELLCLSVGKEHFKAGYLDFKHYFSQISVYENVYRDMRFKSTKTISCPLLQRSFCFLFSSAFNFSWTHEAVWKIKQRHLVPTATEVGWFWCLVKMTKSSWKHIKCSLSIFQGLKNSHIGYPCCWCHSKCKHFEIIFLPCSTFQSKEDITEHGWVCCTPQYVMRCT